VILGTTQFIETFEDLYDALVNSIPGMNSGWVFARVLVPAFGVRGIMGVVDGLKSKDIENQEDDKERKEIST
jgi:adenosine/AMP kinase